MPKDILFLLISFINASWKFLKEKTNNVITGTSSKT